MAFLGLDARTEVRFINPLHAPLTILSWFLIIIKHMPVDYRELATKSITLRHMSRSSLV